MMRRFFERVKGGKRDGLIREAEKIDGFIGLLMKQRNTGVPWSREEVAELKAHLRRPSVYAPILTCVLLPGGFLVLPLISALLDRRKARRTPEKSEVAKMRS